MRVEDLPDNPYLLLTPGPLSTSQSVKATMLRDWCTWDDDYNSIVQDIRQQLVNLATPHADYSAVLMQGSGTFSVEATIGTAIPADGKLLVLTNGAYGNRIAQIANYLHIPTLINDSGEIAQPDLAQLDATLKNDSSITHVAVVHCETTTGMLNPIPDIAEVVKTHNKVFIVDAMSSFGGVPLDMHDWHIDFLISSANKCIQGVPGFGFIIAQREHMLTCQGQARSLSLDLYEQWRVMEEQHGKWRFTSPTHTVRAFAQALVELTAEGGIAVRHQRYQANQCTLVQGMRKLGFRTLLDDSMQSPIITSFYNPTHPDYDFKRFYNALKQQGFVIYPGKVAVADTFRIGTIGEVTPEDVSRLLDAVAQSMYWQ